MYAFIFGFVKNDDYTYDLKPTKKVNILPITSYSSDIFSVLNTDYNYFCGNMNKLALQNGYFSVSAASISVFWKHTATEFETGFDYFGARYYDSDLSIWLSVDPMSSDYPSLSPYNYTAGNPIMFIDPNGQFKVDKSIKDHYPHFYKYLSENLLNDVKNSKNLKKQLMLLGQFSSEEELLKALKNGDGPILKASEHPGSNSQDIEEYNAAKNYAAGWTDQYGDRNTIEISSILLQQFEDNMNNNDIHNSNRSLLAVFSTLMHEVTHWGDINHGEIKNNKIGPESDCYGNNPTMEIGAILEIRVFGLYNSDPASGKDAGSLKSFKFSQARSVEHLLNSAPPNSQYSSKDLPTLPSTNKQ